MSINTHGTWIDEEAVSSAPMVSGVGPVAASRPLREDDRPSHVFIVMQKVYDYGDCEVEHLAAFDSKSAANKYAKAYEVVNPQTDLEVHELPLRHK